MVRTARPQSSRAGYDRLDRRVEGMSLHKTPVATPEEVDGIRTPRQHHDLLVSPGKSYIGLLPFPRSFALPTVASQQAPIPRKVEDTGLTVVGNQIAARSIGHDGARHHKVVVARFPEHDQVAYRDGGLGGQMRGCSDERDSGPMPDGWSWACELPAGRKRDGRPSSRRLAGASVLVRSGDGRLDKRSRVTNNLTSALRTGKVTRIACQGCGSDFYETRRGRILEKLGRRLAPANR